MKHRTAFLTLALMSALAAVSAVLLIVSALTVLVRADPGIRYVAVGGDCGGAVPCFETVQAAVDAALPGDEIRVASGHYSDVSAREGVSQVVYISKTIRLRGGYTTTNWTTVDLVSHPTVLDAQGKGRALYVSGDVSPSIEGLLITGGDATAQTTSSGDGAYLGGGAYISSTAITFSDNVISGNIGSRTSDRGAPAVGGGMWVQAKRVVLEHNAIRDNVAAAYGNGVGGGLAIAGDSVVIRDNLLDENVATMHGSGMGGALDIHGGRVIMSGNLIVNNTASSNTAELTTPAGGGVAILADVVTLTKNTVLSNTVVVSSAVHAIAFGGGIALTADSALLDNNTIQGNTGIASGSGWICGGGLYLEEVNATLDNNIIRGNVSAGSAAYGDGGGICEQSNGTEYSTVLNGNTIAGNVGSVSGSGIGGGVVLYMAGDANHVVFNGNEILSNTAAISGEFGLGGGVVIGNGTVVFDDNVLRGNVAGTVGGGLFLDSVNAALTNTVIVDNQTALTAAGLVIDNNSVVRLLHTTIARNRGGDGSGAVLRDVNTVVMTNTILVSQSVGISVTPGNTLTLNGVLWYNTPITVSQALTTAVSVQNQHIGDPAFAPDGYHLTLGSAAIDRGVFAGVATDVDGHARPMGEGYELGADEVGLVVTKRAEPDPVAAGEPLTYTIRVTNASGVGLNAIITDTLPLHVLPGQTANGTAFLPGGQITWTTMITAPDGVWWETVVVTVAEDYEGPLTNVVQVTTAEGAAGQARVIVNPVKFFLPLLMRGL
jgi:uncharacterized repeat protein (TIGR01451 family)